MKKSFRERHSFLIVISLFALGVLYVFGSKEVFGAPLFISIALFGVDIIWVNLSGLNTAKQAKLWPSTIGKLIKACAVRKRYHDNVYKWFLEINYTYSVAGSDFSSDNYNWVGVVSSSKEKIEKLASNIHSVPALIVKYNPANHSQSVIVPSVSVIYYFGLAIGLVISIFGLGLFFEHFALIKFVGLLRS